MATREDIQLALDSCHQIDGAELMMAALPELLQVLQASSNMVVEISPGRHRRPELHLSFGE